MMKDTLEKIKSDLSEFPIMFAKSLPAATEIEKASKILGIPFARDYYEFLLEFGAAMIGPYPIYGLRPVEVLGNDSWSVLEVTKRYRDDEVPGTAEWAVVSCDHAGNPVGMDKDGVIWIHDHDFGGVAPLAKNFEAYVRIRCLGLSGA